MSPWTTAPTLSPSCTRSMPELAEQMFGGCEETTTGVVRLRAMAADGACAIPSLP